ncbi:MAG: deoxyguanosinetriphosphate triphosphohydrolase [Acidobacteriota bacterium]
MKPGHLYPLPDAQVLASYAVDSARSRGRRLPENDHDFRSAFQRDRDRIVHSRAFRRLEYKTQVFVNHEGEHYRTRLTHSLEVSLLARTVCRTLGLNMDLAECLALSHDLGHTPFGHLGEDVLDRLMAGHGGFDHNRQSLRIVEVLEDRYPGFHGLNLTYEVREGIVKHSGRIDLEREPDLAIYEPQTSAPLEAQMMDLVDELAYNHHDLDDGLESGLLSLEQLIQEVPLFARHHATVYKSFPGATEFQIQAMTLRHLIDDLVTDLVRSSRRRLAEAGISSLAEVRSHPENLIGLSSERAGMNRTLKKHLNEHLYRHPQIEATRDRYRTVLDGLFKAYHQDPTRLPSPHRHRADAGEKMERIICDYIAGMTDRYALDEYQRLYGINPLG